MNDPAVKSGRLFWLASLRGVLQKKDRRKTVWESRTRNVSADTSKGAVRERLLFSAISSGRCVYTYGQSDERLTDTEIIK